MDSLREAQKKVDRNVQDRENRAAAKDQNNQAKGSEAAKPDTGKGDQGTKPDEVKPTEKPKYEAPSRWTATAKAKWEALDDEVKSETDRTVKELEKGMNAYKAKVDDLKEFEDIATKHGTTIKAGLKNYVKLDLDLQSNDPAQKLQALDLIFKTAKVDKAEFARFVLGQQQNQQGQPPVNPELAALRQEWWSRSQE